MIPIEIERKYRLLPNKDEAFFKGYPCTGITQGYLSFDGNEVRIRIGDAKWAPRVAIKQGSSLSRLEYEFDVSQIEGENLLTLAHPYVIKKTRYNVDRWEVDFFEDPATPPIAEIELENEAEAIPVKPGMTFVDFRREVTGDPAYLNRNIALRIGAKAQAAGGYHIRHIPKGMLGKVSKIREELEELEDAAIQENRILKVVELSDLYGALEHCAISEGYDMEDLHKMAQATRRAFETGERK